MDAQEQTEETTAPSGRGRRTAGEGWFPLLGETLLTGLLVLAGSLPVVTAPAALAAGAAHLRRHLGGYDTSVRSFWRDWLAAVRGLWLLGVLALLAAVAVTVNTGLTASGALPGSSAVRWVTWAAAACAAVVLVRTTTAWSDDDVAAGAGAAPAGADGVGGGGLDDGGAGAPGVRQLLSRGAARARDDLTGSALLLAALVMCVVLVWMLTPLVVVTGGLLALAAVAVETRRVRRPVD
ncbi:Poxvirus protein I5 [Promicromonospora kroppenstedtii]|uniref:Poxvirus protein I5 n=1 Tax=Promicromonospora kroppenstedtii TaxID=440482 RepID=A0ABW7XLN8_9MICO